MYPDDRRYSKEHEWVLIESDGRALVGITEYAQEQLGDVVFVELPEPGTKLDQFGKMGEIESVKAVSDIYTPLAGDVAEINQAIVDKPELVNTDPHGNGWLARLASVDSNQLDTLLTADAYESYLSELE
jgi:glycine cleavage system H protein